MHPSNSGHNRAPTSHAKLGVVFEFLADGFDARDLELIADIFDALDEFLVFFGIIAVAVPVFTWV